MNTRILPGALILIIMSVFLSSCRDKNKTDTSEMLIPRQEMIRLMSDIELTEAALRFRQGKISRDSLNAISEKAFDSLYAWHQVSPARFSANLAYYQKDLAGFEKMLDEVILLLTREKDSVANMNVPATDTLQQVKKPQQ